MPDAHADRLRLVLDADHRAYLRPDAVGADQQVDGLGRAVREGDGHGVAVVVDRSQRGAEAYVDTGLGDLLGEEVGDVAADGAHRAGRSGPPIGGVGHLGDDVAVGVFLRRWSNGKPRSTAGRRCRPRGTP